MFLAFTSWDTQVREILPRSAFRRFFFLNKFCTEIRSSKQGLNLYLKITSWNSHLTVCIFYTNSFACNLKQLGNYRKNTVFSDWTQDFFIGRDLFRCAFHLSFSLKWQDLRIDHYLPKWILHLTMIPYSVKPFLH